MRSKRNSYECQCKPATHAFCPSCRTVRQVAFKKSEKRGGNVIGFTKFEGGSLVCEACGAAIVFLYREAPRVKQPTMLQEAMDE